MSQMELLKPQVWPHPRPPRLLVLLVLLVPLLAGCSARAHRAYRASATMAGQFAYHVDLRQTLYALDHGFPEANPLYGAHPSTARLVAGQALAQGSQLGLLYLTEKLPDRGPETEWVKDVIVTVPALLAALVVLQNGNRIGWETWERW